MEIGVLPFHSMPACKHLYLCVELVLGILCCCTLLRIRHEVLLLELAFVAVIRICIFRDPYQFPVSYLCAARRGIS